MGHEDWTTGWDSRLGALSEENLLDTPCVPHYHFSCTHHSLNLTLFQTYISNSDQYQRQHREKLLPAPTIHKKTSSSTAPHFCADAELIFRNFNPNHLLSKNLYKRFPGERFLPTLHLQNSARIVKIDEDRAQRLISINLGILQNANWTCHSRKSLLVKFIFPVVTRNKRFTEKEWHELQHESGTW